MKELLKQMTIAEKVGQLNQRLYGWKAFERKGNEIILTDYFKDEVSRWGGIGLIYGVFRADPWSEMNFKKGLNVEESRYVADLIQNYIKENTRLKIPVILTEESPHGHQGLYSQTFPTNYSVGNSWNPNLYQQTQAVVADDLLLKGANLGLITALDLCRDPRWGRTEETFSEDPFLTKTFALAALKGLQGNDGKHIPEDKVLAVFKHFAAYGSSMGGHNAGPVNIGPRELREIHLYSMQALVENGLNGVMASYNDIDGIPSHGNKAILTDYLRSDLGFDGFVMADGVALDRLASIENDPRKGASWAIESGVDVSLWDNTFTYLDAAVEEGLLDIEVIDQAVLRVLEAKQKLGLFNKEQRVYSSRFTEKDKRALNQQMATESLVLLKNEKQTLPLSKKMKKIAILGPNADKLYNQLGDYTAYQVEDLGSTLLQGMQNYVSTHGLEQDLVFAEGCEITRSSEDTLGHALKLAEDADLIILAVGGSSARDFDTQFDANGAAISGSYNMTSGENIDLADLNLPSAQVELITQVHSLEKPTVGVFIQGRPHILATIDKYFDAILIAGYPGLLAGDAIASVLYGDVSPSGKLATSIPDHSGQLPSYYNYRDTSFSENYFDLSGKAKYSFGMGLSYTQFMIDELELNAEGLGLAEIEAGESLVLSGKIKNVGDFSGSEVIQVYLKSSIPKVFTRVKELRQFKKIALEVNEEKVFDIYLNKSNLESLDSDFKAFIPRKIKVIVEATNFTETFDLSLN